MQSGRSQYLTSILPPVHKMGYERENDEQHNNARDEQCHRPIVKDEVPCIAAHVVTPRPGVIPVTLPAPPSLRHGHPIRVTVPGTLHLWGPRSRIEHDTVDLDHVAVIPPPLQQTLLDASALDLTRIGGRAVDDLLRHDLGWARPGPLLPTRPRLRPRFRRRPAL
jgi:hypothetical protein